MKIRVVNIVGAISLLVLVLGIFPVFAGGFQIYQAGSADAIALGAATVGRDDLISGAWYNPASIVDFKKTRYESGYALAKVNWEYEPGNGARKFKIEDKMYVVPGTHIVHPINDRYTAAFSLYTPFGLGIKWQDQDARDLANTGLFNDPVASPPGMTVTKAIPVQVDLQVPYLNSTIATKLSEKFSVAGGLSLIKADFKARFLSKGTVLPATVAWDKIIKYQADGWGAGYVLAAHYKANADWKIGFRYLSHSDVKLKGTVEDHPEIAIAAMKGTLRLPYTLSLGFVNSSVDRWLLSCDIMRTGWSRFDELKIEPSDAGQTKGGFSTPKNWHDTTAYRFGAEYKYSDIWTLRAGYVYDNSPVAEETRNFDLPGTDGHIFSVGASRKSRNHVVDIGYSYMLLEKGRAGTNSLNGVGEFSGADNHFLMVSYSRML